MGTRHRKYTRELLEEAVAESTSVMGVLRYLGMPQAGGTHAHVSRKIREFGILTNPFVRYPGPGRQARLTPEEIPQVVPFGSARRKPGHLRRALVELGVAYRCRSCGLEGKWQGQDLTLHVDHISGDIHDNRITNLQFLCPNCHSQTATFAGRHKGSYGRGAYRQ